MIIRKSVAGLMLLLPALLSADASDWLRHSQDIMGTRLVIEIQPPSEAQGRACINRAVAEMQRIENTMSPYLAGSELSAINRDAGIQPVAISTEMETLLGKALAMSQLSSGAFDITFSSIGYRYDYRRGLKPDDSEVSDALPAIDYRKLRLANHQLAFDHPAMRIDLGGIAKGYAVDRAVDNLRDCGITRAYVAAGGDSRMLGDRGGRPWVVGIQHPRDETALMLRLPLADSALSTSGDYERFFMVDGERVHHILDPRTGHSSRASMGVSVIGPDATTTDALSTSLFVLGMQQGLQLIEQMPDYEALVIDADGRVGYSSGLQWLAARQAADNN